MYCASSGGARPSSAAGDALLVGALAFARVRRDLEHRGAHLAQRQRLRRRRRALAARGGERVEVAELPQLGLERVGVAVAHARQRVDTARRRRRA